MQVPFRQGVVKSVPNFLQLTLGGTSLFGVVPLILTLPVQIPSAATWVFKATVR